MTVDMFAQRAPWFLAGPAIGLLVVALLWACNRTFGALGGFIDLLAWVRAPQVPPKHTVYFFAGLLIGGFVYSIVAGVQPGWAYGTFDQRFGVVPAARLGILVVAGTVMGYGTRMASGCTSGHGICGTALGSPRSIVSTMVFMGTAIIAANALGAILGITR
jgi:uncharacterized membrane protein YedE/YeeE